MKGVRKVQACQQVRNLKPVETIADLAEVEQIEEPHSMKVSTGGWIENSFNCLGPNPFKGFDFKAYHLYPPERTKDCITI